MMKISTMIGAGLLTLATTIQPAEAIPMQPISDALIGTDNVTAVYFRRGFYAAGGSPGNTATSRHAMGTLMSIASCRVRLVGADGLA